MYARVFRLTIAFCIILTLSAADAQGYSYSERTTVIGAIRTYTIMDREESLIELAREFDLGYNEITDANPHLDPFVPGAGESVLVPTSWILPEIAQPYNGIVINLSELRLYYFFRRANGIYVETFPIGIGSQGTDTPVGVFRVIEKITNPAWHVPASIRKEKPELPLVVPAGPDNPLGSHALRLSLPSILIHGTNRPFAVGRKASHGCIRLYPEDIPKLFGMVPKGMQVTIIRQPVKIGVKEGRIFIEVHKDNKLTAEDYFNRTMALLVRYHRLDRVSPAKLFRALGDKSGYPVEITKDASEFDAPAGEDTDDKSLREGMQYKDLFLLL